MGSFGKRIFSKNVRFLKIDNVEKVAIREILESPESVDNQGESDESQDIL